MRGPGALGGAASLALLLLGSAGCRPIVVDAQRATFADVLVRARPADLNILGVGLEGPDGRIVLRTTGASIPRGETARIGVMGPGLEPGTGLLVVGVGFRTRLVRFAVTSGGGVDPMPAAVLEIDVPPTAESGLYSIAAFREGRLSIFSGALEVL